MIRRWTRDPRVLLDLVFAAVVGVLAVIDVSATSGQHLHGQRAADGWAYALVITGSLSLVWRRRTPIAVLTVVTAVVVAFWLRDNGALLSVVGL
ncbi:MAG: hypothetical protein JWL70_2543, partial [Acidimicrobiia bacterium]|nr:hypothetical protein [Acidimicrobiia bacterium]